MFKLFKLKWSGRAKPADKQAAQCALDLLLHTVLPMTEVRKQFLEQYPDQEDLLESMIEDIQAVGDRA